MAAWKKVCLKVNRDSCLGEPMKSKKTPVTIQPSSGNVFADLELADADELLAKAKLVQCICDILARRKLTQTRAAQLLGVDQPKASALMGGKFAGFSTDRLLRFLNALGQDIDIVIRPSKNKRETTTRVVTASTAS